jgi:cytidine deaminase
VYVEPYPKSLTSELYGAAVQIDESAADSDALRFDAFVGIAPRRYMDCFRAPRQRKDEMGYRVTWRPEVAQPRFQTLLEGHEALETFVAGKLDAVKRELKLT